jgi:phosphoribosylformylglycinamidine synthase
MGIPTVGGELAFHPSFNGNCLVNAFALGIVKQDQVFLGRAAGVGNVVLYVGSKTGRDGIHGASMSSEAFGDDSESKRPTVQVGDPFQEKLLLEACLEAFKSGCIVGIQDMGAAGLTSSSFEMADRGETGVRLHLDRVPQREVGMNPYEIMLSESQERMLIVVEAGKENIVIDIFKRWELDAVAIGEVISGANVELYWNGEQISSMPAQLLTSAVPEYDWPQTPPTDQSLTAPIDVQAIAPPADLPKAWLSMLSSPNLCSRHKVYSQYDSTVRTNTVVHPGGDAGVVRIKGSATKDKPEKGVAISLDCNSRFCNIDPHKGTGHSLAEGIRNLACVGAMPIGISDCLNMPSPERAETMWQIAQCIAGLGDAARKFDVPVVSGNVSMYNETNGKGILPTPLLAVVGLLDDVTVSIGSHFKESGDAVILLGKTDESELGGSEYLSQQYGIEKGALPSLTIEAEIKNSSLVRELIKARLLVSAHDLSAGGLGVSLAEACFSDYSRAVGVTLTPSRPITRPDAYLFSESGARYLISCKAENLAKVKELIETHGVEISAEGTVGGEYISIPGVASINSVEARNVWWSGLDGLFTA